MTGISLAERLGHGPEARLLIVNCDDLGSSHGANVAAHLAMTRGVATSASLMVPCPWAREAARMFNGLPVGVHLTLTSEYTGYRWRGLTGGASLYDRDGFLSATTAIALGTMTAEEARAECRAQIDAALSWGVDVTHLDSHMDVIHRRADLHEVYLDLAQEFRVPVRVIDRDATAQQGLRPRARAAVRGVLCNDHLIYPWPRRTHDVLVDEIPRLPRGVSEIFAHPVLDGRELRACDTAHADVRVQDAACLTDPTIADLLDRHGVIRISYRDLREAQRAG